MGSSSTCFVGNLLRKIAAFRILLPVIFSALPYVAGFWTRRAPSEISTVREFESSPSDRSASTRHWVDCSLSFCPMPWVPQFGCIWPRKDTNFQASCNMLCYHQSVSAKTIIHLFNIWTNSNDWDYSSSIVILCTLANVALSFILRRVFPAFCRAWIIWWR